jgi:prolipoprotein diacylglyceryl transferase
MNHLIAWLYWNPSKTAFTVPLLDRPVAWYGILFVTGFILGYLIIIPIFSRFLRQTKHLSALDIKNWPLLLSKIQSDSSNTIVSDTQKRLNSTFQTLATSAALDTNNQDSILQALNAVWKRKNLKREEIETAFPGAIEPINHTSHFLADRLCWFIVLGTLIGARLGAVFFYDWPYFRTHPMEIFKVWNGGLASHGGTIGVAIALYLYILYVKKWVPSLSFLTLMDCVSIPVPLAACFIRLGNFVNQEILGTHTLLPWGVIFGSPVDGSSPIPRHPVQLYEAISYFLAFVIFYLLWKKGKDRIGSGLISGLMFVLIYSSRIILEFWKETQESSLLDSEYLQAGQLLSIPFVLIGFALIWHSQKKQALSKSLN